jgi:glycosyltransferase involved in cell wall biosynthesis
VLYVGRLSPEKGVGALLDAWRQQAPDLELVIVGTGPLETVLRDRAPRSVSFVGSQPREAVTELMLAARALVFPSVCYEGQPLVPLEAAAAGLPVVLPDLGAMSGLLGGDAHELRYPAGSLPALAERLGRLLDDDVVDRHGLHTRACFEAKYTHEAALRHLEDTYRTFV